MHVTPRPAKIQWLNDQVVQHQPYRQKVGREYLVPTGRPSQCVSFSSGPDMILRIQYLVQLCHALRQCYVQ
jgi:hypothetical protein